MDPYAVLGVARNAPVEEIRRAYVALARSTHPDVRGDDPEAAEHMRRINLAWEMLSDADSRAAIDRRLTQPPTHQPGPGAAPAGAPADRPRYEEADFGHDDFDDVDFDADDRPITEGNLPGWMRLGAPAAFVIGIFAVIGGVLAAGFVLVRFGVALLILSALLFLLSPFVVLIRSRGGPLR